MFRVAIIGRANVGKSTFFNRVIRSKLDKAIVANQPGITRDRKEYEVFVRGKYFTLIDTAGLEPAKKGTVEELMMQQTQVAIDSADLILFMIDGRMGATAVDLDFARVVRKKNMPVKLIANKCEGNEKTWNLEEVHKLGFGEAYLVSSEHNLGVSSLFDDIVDFGEEAGFDMTKPEKPESEQMRLAIIGRPNVGKSTFFNFLLGENRSIVADFPGTTRDSIYVDYEYKDSLIKLIDTAGIRKKAGKSKEEFELLFVEDSYQSIDYADVVILMIDANNIDPYTGLDRQDMALANYAIGEGRGLVIAVNKCDTLVGEDLEKVLEEAKHRIENSYLSAANVPVINMSAINGRNGKKAIDAAIGQLNRWLNKATTAHIPPLVNGRRLTLKYATQIKTKPPTIAIFTSSRVEGLPDSYVKYLTKSLCNTFEYSGVPIRIILRKQKNPFDNDGE
jgi:GTPase